MTRIMTSERHFARLVGGALSWTILLLMAAVGIAIS